MTTNEGMLRAHEALLNGGRLAYFERRGIRKEIVEAAYLGYDPSSDAFTYPCFNKGGELLAIHFKSERRDGKNKRRQWWGGYATDLLPPKGRGKNPDDPAKVIPFGLETLSNLEPGSPVVLCCGEEDALSLRSVGLAALSQPGAGLLEPVYAEEFAGYECAVFYDAGEEREAQRDAEKLLEAGAKVARVVRWPAEAEHGADINLRLVEVPDAFGAWAEDMIAGARSVSSFSPGLAERAGRLDEYGHEGAARAVGASGGVGTLLSEVASERVDWLWDERIPKGKLTIIEGDPGEGKSALTTDLAARVSVGRPWTDGAPNEAGGVVTCSAEDGVADTIRPRLDAAGGDPSKVLSLSMVRDESGERPIFVPDDLDAIEAGIERVSAKLLILDPLAAFLSGKYDVNKDTDVRRALVPLAKLAETSGVAVVVVRHLTKGERGKPIYRGGGRIGIVGAARSALLVARHPEDDRQRVLAPVKSNLSKQPPSLVFALGEAANGAVSVEWKGETPHTAENLLSAPVNTKGRPALEEAMDFLQEALGGGPRAAKTLFEEAKRVDISKITLKRAKIELGVRSEKESDGSWTWRLPEGKGIKVRRSPEEDPLDPLESLGVTEGRSALEEDQEDQEAQGDPLGEGEPLAIVDNGPHSGWRCIHDVPGGCWLCNKAGEEGEQGPSETTVSSGEIE